MKHYNLQLSTLSCCFATSPTTKPRISGLWQSWKHSCQACFRGGGVAGGCRGVNNILVNVLPSLHWDRALATGAYLDTNVSSVHTLTPLTMCISRRDTNMPWWQLQSGPTVPTNDSTRCHNQHVFTTAPCPCFHAEYHCCQRMVTPHT